MCEDEAGAGAETAGGGAVRARRAVEEGAEAEVVKTETETGTGTVAVEGETETGTTGAEEEPGEDPGLRGWCASIRLTRNKVSVLFRQFLWE